MATSGSRHGTLGILWILYGVLCLVKAAWIVVYSGTLTLMWGAIVTRVANPFLWMDMFHIWLTAFTVILVLAGIFSFLAALSLMRGPSTSNALALVASVLAMITNPLGIPLGAYTMVVTVPRPVAESRANYASAA